MVATNMKREKVGSMENTSTMRQAQSDIIDDFSQLGEWLDKYEYLVKLGKDHDGLEERYKTDDYAIAGCQSQVWILARKKNDRLFLNADSDSLITKGILALLLRVTDGRTPDEIADSDFFFLNEIGLSTNLSPARANGVNNIVGHIRRLAEENR
jgi:cysteine desulfuration protein SufE